MSLCVSWKLYLLRSAITTWHELCKFYSTAPKAFCTVPCVQKCGRLAIQLIFSARARRPRYAGNALFNCRIPIFCLKASALKLLPWNSSGRWGSLNHKFPQRPEAVGGPQPRLCGPAWLQGWRRFQGVHAFRRGVGSFPLTRRNLAKYLRVKHWCWSPCFVRVNYGGLMRFHPLISLSAEL